ncbi:MAG: hypothetical protein NT062_31185 [Proteobacteria bacterium]|nr:hypothetical protein [Pseudomonadota bacterium]
MIRALLFSSLLLGGCGNKASEVAAGSAGSSARPSAASGAGPASGAAATSTSSSAMTAGSSDDCKATVDAAIDRMIEAKKGSDGTLAPDRQARMDKLREVLARRCAADKWSAEMMTCVKVIAAQPDLMKCQGQFLEPEAQKALQDDIISVMAGSRRPGGMPPVSAP